ncbi:MAG: phage holin family protein [Chloroflexi bacterium]|nr:phage holin family protein [Chloroflexota bacterium]
MFWKLLVRWGITAVALAVAAYTIPGITVGGNGLIAVLATAVILGFVNAIIRPVLMLLSCGCIVATLGLFMFVINALMLWLASSIAQNWFGLQFVVKDFWAALFGSIVISIVAFILSIFLPDTDDEIAGMRRSLGQ